MRERIEAGGAETPFPQCYVKCLARNEVEVTFEASHSGRRGRERGRGREREGEARIRRRCRKRPSYVTDGRTDHGGIRFTEKSTPTWIDCQQPSMGRATRTMDGEREGPVNFCNALTQDSGASYDEDLFCRGAVKNAHTHDLQ